MNGPRQAAASATAATLLALPVVAAGAGTGAEAEPPVSPPPPPADPAPPPPPAEPDWQAIAEERAVKLRRARRVLRYRLRQVRGLRQALSYRLTAVGGALTCVHTHEGSWRDSGDPYWGGLQMDRSFQLTYGRPLVQRYGWANRWPAEAQIAVGTVAVYSGRGYGPWPNTSRMCGL
jgi:hypothetical protein